MPQLDRITHVPDVMQGKATIRGTRVTVGMILEQLATGTSMERLLEAYPYLEREDVLQSIWYGALCASKVDEQLADGSLEESLIWFDDSDDEEIEAKMASLKDHAERMVKLGYRQS